MAKPIELSLTITEAGWLDFEAELTYLEQVEPTAFIGLPEGTPDTPTPDGRLGVLSRGAVNEFGAPSVNVPSRPWLRTSFDNNAKAWGDKLTSAPLGELAAVFEEVVDSAVKATRESVEKWADPRNARYTVLVKGFNDPLTETGALAASVARRMFYGAARSAPTRSQARSDVPTRTNTRSGASGSSAAAWARAAKQWAGARAEFGFIAPTRSVSKKATRTLFTPKLKYKGRASYKVPSKV